VLWSVLGTVRRATARTRWITASRSGRMPTTSVRRPVSWCSRSRVLSDQPCRQNDESARRRGRRRDARLPSGGYQGMHVDHPSGLANLEHQRVRGGHERVRPGIQRLAPERPTWSSRSAADVETCDFDSRVIHSEPTNFHAPTRDLAGNTWPPLTWARPRARRRRFRGAAMDCQERGWRRSWPGQRRGLRGGGSESDSSCRAELVTGGPVRQGLSRSPR
jgi:hypothetical protein